MASSSSSSSSISFCFQCEDSSNSVGFRNGWRLRSGKFAQLCHRCAGSALPLTLDQISRVRALGMKNHVGSASLEWTRSARFGFNWGSTGSGHRVENQKKQIHLDVLYMSTGDSVRLSILVMMAGGTVNLVGRLVEKLIHCGCIVSFNTYLLLDFGGIMCMECSKKNFILARNRCLSHETPVPSGESQLDATQTMIERQYVPHVTESKLQKISINPLFQKLLSASDADLALSRLVIPKKCAEAYFPRLSGPHKIPINILDTEGKEWNFHFRFWPNSRSKMYVLEGLRDYMVSKKWQAGDVVTFYRIEPGQKLVMGLRNTSAGSTT